MNNEWLYKINLALSGEITWDAQKALCESAINGIEKVLSKLEKSGIEDWEQFSWELGNLKVDFETRLLDYEDMDIEDSLEETNWLLDTLYDIGDRKVIKNSERRKFIWIGKL